MNQLSLLFYWGNISGHISNAFVGIGFVIFVIALILGGLKLYTQAEVLSDIKDVSRYHRLNDDNIEQLKTLVTNLRKLGLALPVCLLFLAFLLWTAACFAPSQDTVYAIAASELGDRALHSQVVGTAEKALESWLNRQINPDVPVVTVETKKKDD